MPQLPVLHPEFVNLRLTSLHVFRHLAPLVKTRHTHRTPAIAYLALDLIRLPSQLLHLPIVVPPLDDHLLVLPLKPLNRLLARQTLVLGMALGALQLLLRIRELLVHPLQPHPTV